ncbi:MAG: sigma 54-interacting transcriptional regulator [Steroidobacteraceae bacterium]
MNTSAIPGGTARSGAVRPREGAFTGADQLRRGRFEQADGGTLFLDEIGDMSTPLQTRLLRACWPRASSIASAARHDQGGCARDPRRPTHQNGEDRVQRGQFREDLFHRLNVIRIELPPLRARREDVGDLLDHYLRVAAQELGVDPKTLSPAARAKLEGYHWPGNVRELVNLCRRMTVLAPGAEIRPDDLPAEIARPGEAPSGASWNELLARWADAQPGPAAGPALLDVALPEFERTLIRVALKRTQGHRQEAARLLGWGRNTLTRKLKELGLSDADEDNDDAA